MAMDNAFPEFGAESESSKEQPVKPVFEPMPSSETPVEDVENTAPAPTPPQFKTTTSPLASEPLPSPKNIPDPLHPSTPEGDVNKNMFIEPEESETVLESQVENLQEPQEAEPAIQPGPPPSSQPTYIAQPNTRTNENTTAEQNKTPIDSKEVQEFKEGIKEIARTTAIITDTYIQLLIGIESNKNFKSIRKMALSTQLISAESHLAVLELLREIRVSTPAEYHPPLIAVMFLASISASCTLITASSSIEEINKNFLLSPKTVRTITKSKDVNRWLTFCLSDES